MELKMFEVGKTYTANNGYDYECISVRGDFAWLTGNAASPAYVWRMDGTSVSLNDSYNFAKPTDPRDQEIADLKTRVAVLTAIVNADEYTIDLTTHTIMRDHSETCVHVWRKKC